MSSNPNAASEAPASSLGDKARLLQHNRRVRHLHGITLRNLNLNPQAGRDRTKTIDDEALPFSLKSPTKLRAIEDHNKLVLSRSHENLRLVRDDAGARSGRTDSALEDGGKLKPPSQRPRKPRRRSTLEWANTTAAQRQQSIRDAVARRRADVFFSLHVPGQEEPVYVSEVAEKITNASFRAFDLRACGHGISRSDNLSLRLWVKNEADLAWQLLMTLSVHLPTLQYVGSALETFPYRLPDNCLIFRLVDGLYTTLTDVPLHFSHPLTLLSTVNGPSGGVQPTSSLDSLMRLATLDECIQDAISDRETISEEINALIDKNRDAFFANDRLAQRNEDLIRIKQSIAEDRRSVLSTRAKVEELRTTWRARKNAISTGHDAHRKTSEHLESNSPHLERSRKAHVELQDAISAQRRRICSDLSDVYAIEPIPKRALAFKIQKISLPNSDFSNAAEDPISAALGHVAHLVYLLSMYLAIPLPYPITPRSSTSTIEDPISIMSGNRIFPLYMPGSIIYRFEYGVFLLNKNIELLASKLGLKILDIRQTLPNLKYVLYVATAGKGELPARKVGGVRGLLAKRGGTDTPDSSRMSSPDGTAVSELSLRKHLTGGGKIEYARPVQTRMSGRAIG